ncbi:MAG: rod shape-determining protein MreC, partial [Flavobacteriaceae bacterium]|nr:rod shape-determining protein MreC [Flavobacteriaceae bacterium]
MKSLIRFILKYHFFILFILIQFFSLFLVVQYNNYQRASFINSSNAAFAWFYSGVNEISSYFSLRQTNTTLAKENEFLHNLYITNYKENKVKVWEVKDSLYSQQYSYMNAEVINNSVNKQRNYITINVGTKQGIGPEMAVISSTGVVGIVKESSKNFSVVIPILNRNLMISAKLKNQNYFGSISWNGIDYSKCNLNEIPYHINLNVGDTIVTSGYSAIFPQGIIIGTISEYSKPEGE